VAASWSLRRVRIPPLLGFLLQDSLGAVAFPQFGQLLTPLVTWDSLFKLIGEVLGGRFDRLSAQLDFGWSSMAAVAYSCFE
jgi:hypothetical protein